MSSSGHGFLDQPRMHEVRVIEREGKRWLQQYRNKPDGFVYEYAWVDVAELPRPPSNVRPLNSRR
jgi:hypothetical protein